MSTHLIQLATKIIQKNFEKVLFLGWSVTDVTHFVVYKDSWQAYNILVTWSYKEHWKSNSGTAREASLSIVAS